VKITMKAAISLAVTLLLLTMAEGCRKKSGNGLKHRLARPKMAIIEDATLRFSHHCGRYPGSLEELLKPPSGLEGKWDGPYLKPSNLLDPWGRKYLYVPEGKVNPGSFDLISYGADGKQGGEGKNEDIYNE